VPTCSRCKAAGSACTAFNPKGEAEIPRSVVHFLELEIANLETELNREVPDEGVESSHILHPESESDDGQLALLRNAVPIGRDPLKEAILGSNELQSMIGATMPSGTCLTDMLSNVRMGLTPSYTPSSLSDPDIMPAQCSVSTRQLDDDFVEIPILVSLPAQVIHSLVKKFVQRVLPIYPFLHEPAIWAHVERVIQKIPAHHLHQVTPAVRPDYDFLMVYLILAISSTLRSANSGHETRCMAFSGSLFSEGIHHLSSKAPFPNDLAEIQSTILILQYALINPKYANVWVLSGVVMRSCLDLGLHREVSSQLDSTPSQST